MKSENNYSYSLAKGNLREEAIRLHHQRYMEVGFFSQNEMDPYEGVSEYFVAQTEDLDSVVGVTRLIFDKIDELPTITNFKIYDIERARLNQLTKGQFAEFSAFTKMQNHDVGMGLIKSVLEYSSNQNMTHWVCCLDQRVYNYIHRMFKFPFRVVGESKVYLGSTTIPCSLNLSECLSTLKELRPALYDYLVDFEVESTSTFSAEVSL